jgi:peptidoglycan/xylan/chitin deacetylase (PgdA/CDA1 family)
MNRKWEQSSRLADLKRQQSNFKTDSKGVVDTSTLKIGLLMTVCILVSFLWVPIAGGELRDTKANLPELHIPILLYHRFGPTISDSMTIRTAVFESHLKYLRDNGYTVISLRQLVNCRLGKGHPLPLRSVVIVADDGHESIYTEMLPLIKKYRVPVTLFIYPSAISNARYAMTWEQLREIKRTGFFEIQSHTYWHPDFRKEKKRLSNVEYVKFVEMQMKKSKDRLEKELDSKVDMLAWPFGICDDWLISKATEAGYVASFTIERHQVSDSDSIMSLPRYLLQDTDQGMAFEIILKGNSREKNNASVSPRRHNEKNS